jgi:hypothetical protein
MKLIVAGGRDFCPSIGLIDSVIRAHGRYKPTELISGGCRGVDLQAEAWARAEGVPIKRFDADWNAAGRAAGPIRNRAMAEYAGAFPNSALIAFWDGKSKGTGGMVDLARKHGLMVYVEQLILDG